MRLTDEQIYRMWKDEMGKLSFGMDWAPAVVATVRRCLALAAAELRRLSADVEALRRDQRCAGLEGDETGSPCNTYKLLEARHAEEVEALRKALQDIASGELGVNLCIKVAQAALAARPGEKG